MSHEADAYVRFNPSFGEVEDGAGFQCALCDAKGSFYHPQLMILVDDLRGREIGIGNVAFEAVSLSIRGDFLLVYADHDIVLDDKEFIVTCLRVIK